MAVKTHNTSYMTLQERKFKLIRVIKEMEKEGFESFMIKLYEDQLIKVNQQLEK